MILSKKIIDGFEDYKISETLPEGYTDISSITNWIKYGEYFFKDYKFIRKQLQELDWSLLTDLEKLIVSKYRATTEQNCKDTLQETFDYWMTDFGIKSKQCRV